MDEKEKFIFDLTKDHKHSGKDFFTHLKNTSNIIRDLFPEDQYLIDAGLYHSVYGTQSYYFRENITRNEVKNLIGEKSEFLVFIFCSLKDRVNKILEHKFVSDIQKDLYILEYANQLEQQDFLNNQQVIDQIQSSLLRYYNVDIKNLIHRSDFFTS